MKSITLLMMIFALSYLPKGRAFTAHNWSATSSNGFIVYSISDNVGNSVILDCSNLEDDGKDIPHNLFVTNRGAVFNMRDNYNVLSFTSEHKRYAVPARLENRMENSEWRSLMKMFSRGKPFAVNIYGFNAFTIIPNKTLTKSELSDEMCAVN